MANEATMPRRSVWDSFPGWFPQGNFAEWLRAQPRSLQGADAYCDKKRQECLARERRFHAQRIPPVGGVPLRERMSVKQWRRFNKWRREATRWGKAGEQLKPWHSHHKRWRALQREFHRPVLLSDMESKPAFERFINMLWEKHPERFADEEGPSIYLDGQTPAEIRRRNLNRWPLRRKRDEAITKKSNPS